MNARPYDPRTNKPTCVCHCGNGEPHVHPDARTTVRVFPGDRVKPLKAGGGKVVK